MCKKCRLLALLASGDVALKEVGIPSNEKPFSQWLRMHVYWWQLESGVITLANKLELENDAVRKLHLEAARESGQSIAAALQFYHAHHFNKAFLCWKANIKATNDATEQPHFGCTVRRLLYRWWLGYILKVSRFPISEHSSNAWVDSEREEIGIYPEDWIGDLQGTDAWRDCPWFLDYADGEFPDDKEGAYYAHHKKVKGKGKSFSATINQPKDAHSPSTAKGRPPRTAKGRPSTSKKRPRPAVSESSESLEEQFELLSREDVKIAGMLTLSNSQIHDGLALQDGADLDDSEATQIKPIHLAVLCDIDNIHRAICDRRAPQEGLQDIRKLLGSLSYTGQMDPNAQLGGVRLMWADLPTHCKVDAGFGGVPLWNVFTDGIVQSVFTIAAEFLLDDGTLVVATLIVTMFARDLDGPLHVPFYDRRADVIAADIDGYKADSDMLQKPLQESSWTLDTSGAAF
ncbi:hypothetical protein L7F22_014709 [Adiantum nelumboides]|nr:hypothetical protein [Adiantum nelumboides]